jgi:transposase
MAVDIKVLPDDPLKLKEIISRIESEYESRINLLLEEIKYLRDKQYGRKSEKYTEEDKIQGRLFNEAEDGFTAENKEKNEEYIEIKYKRRKKAGRKPIPEYLPRKVIVYDLNPEEKNCPCCGKERPPIGEETTEELEYIPAEVYVNRYIVKKYGPCVCEGFKQSEEPLGYNSKEAAAFSSREYDWERSFILYYRLYFSYTRLDSL